MSDTKSLAQQIRERLNATAGKEIAKTFSPGESLVQVERWVELPPWFEKCTGGKGFALGHITVLIGEPDSGKTTLLTEGIVSCQKAGGIAFLIDSEHKYSMERLRLMNGDPESVVVLQPDTLEEAWDTIETVLRDVKAMRESGFDAPVLLGWDSVAASVPAATAEKSAGDVDVAVDARINNRNVRRLRSLIRETQVAFVGISHYYMTMPGPFKAPKLKIKGGEEMAFMAVLVIKTEQGAQITRTVKGEDQKIGRSTKYTVHKSHLGGRTINSTVHVVDAGILETKEQLDAYKRSLRGEY